MAKLISELRELSQEYIFGESPADCNKDRAANRQGRYGDPNKSCKEVCGNLRPPTLDKKY